MAVLTPQAREAYLYSRNLDRRRRASAAPTARQASRNDLALERQFVAAGGLLLAGPDPTGNGGVIPGFGDQREVELLVEAGFTPRGGDPHRHAERRDLPRPADRIGSIAPARTPT